MTESLVQNLDPNLKKQPTNLSAINTRFASERTLMAAVRTSLSLIGFGFTIYKVFESMRQTMGERSPIRVNGPRRLGLTLVSIGIFVLVAFALQHWLFLKELKKETNQEFPWSVSLITSVLLTITGLVVLVTILVRL